MRRGRVLTVLFVRALFSAVAGVGGIVLSPGVAVPQSGGEEGAAARVVEGERSLQWEVDFGYGYGIDISSAATFLGNVRFVGGRVRLGRVVGGRYREQSPLEGRMSLLAELPAWMSLEPERGYAIGVTFLARYSLARMERLGPFAELGVGPIHLDFDNERSQADGLSFTLQGGIGVMRRLTSNWALAARAQVHHISNAGLRRPNPGINDLLFTVGVSRNSE